ICAVAARAGIAPVVVGDAGSVDLAQAAVVLVPPSAADAVAGMPPGVPRWIYGDGDASAKVASAAIACAAAGVLLLPVRPAVLTRVWGAPPAPIPEADLARARSLIAASVLDGSGEPTPEGLAAIARCFAADDCMLWWREGDGMVPWGTRSIADADQASLS